MGTPQAGYSDAAATGHLDGSVYRAGYAGPGQQAAPDPGWYSADTGGEHGASYYDTSYNSTGPGGTGYRDSGGYTGNGYTGAEYYDGSYADRAYQGGYPAASVQPGGYAGGAFQGNQPDPASYQPHGQYAGHYDQRAIGAPDVAYGHDGYQGYPGYGGNGH